MKNKKLALSVLSTAVVGSMASSAFALEPGIYIGGSADKHYSIAGFLNQLEQDRDNFLKNVVNPNLSSTVYVDPSKKGVNLWDFASGDEENLNDALKDLTAADFDADTYTLENGQSWKASEDQDLQPAPAGELKVESVSAINLRTITVNFNKAVDDTTVTAGTVALQGKTYDAALNTIGDYDFKVSEDGKSVVFTVVGLAQNEDVTVSINGVKTEAGEELKNFTQEVTVLDTTTPTATELKVVAPNTFTIKFSEPLKTAPTVKINDGAVSNVVTFNAGDDYVTVKAASLNAGDNKVTIQDGADYADLPVVKQDKTLKYELVTTAPVVTVKESTNTSVTLKFDRKVTNLQTNAVKFSHTYKGLNIIDGDNGTAVTKISDTEYKVDFGTGNPLPPGTTKLYIDYAPNTADADKIQDDFGNILPPTALDVTTTADTTKPTVTSATFDATTGKIVVVFSEKVGTTSAELESNYVLRNSLNQIVTVTTATKVSDNKVELTIPTLKAGNYTLEISNVEDVAVVPNKLDKVTKTFTVADTIAPEVESAINVTGTTVRVTFSKDMNSTDLVNKAYYLFDGKALPAGTTLTAAGSKAVDIKFPAGTVFTSKTITVNGEMRDSLGNKIGGFASAPVPIDPASASEITLDNISDATFTAKNKVQFTVDQHLTAVDATKFTITTGSQSNPAVAGDVTYVNNPDGTATVTVVTDTAGTTGIDTSVASDLSDLTSIDLAAGALTNSFNVATTGAITIDAADVTDAIKASLDSASAQDANGNGQIDTVEVTFDESVKADSIQASDFTVEGYVVKGVKSVNGAVVTLTVQENGVGDTGATPKVTLVGSVEDLNGNVGIGATKEVTATDKALPLLDEVVFTNDDTPGTATLTAGDKITLTFTEAVKLSSGAVLGDKATDNTFVALTDAVASSPDSNGFSTVWVITLASGDLANIGFNAAGSTAVELKVDKTKVVDKATNAPAADAKVATPEGF